MVSSDPLTAGAGRGAVRFARWNGGAPVPAWDDVAPEVADLIVVPWLPTPSSGDPMAAGAAVAALLQRLPYYAAFPDKHVLLDNSDLDVLDRNVRGHVFKVSAGWRDQRVYPLAYNVPDPGPPPSISTTTVDVAFTGALTTHPIREAMNRWRYGWSDWVVAFDVVEPFWTLPPDVRAGRRERYANQIRAARFVLCPRGRALNSRRLFEVLAHGRIPILYADAARLPLEGRIPWERIVVRVPEGFGKWTPEFVDEFLSENELEASSELARAVWLSYFAPGCLRALVVATLTDAGVVQGRGKVDYRPHVTDVTPSDG